MQVFCNSIGIDQLILQITQLNLFLKFKES